MSSSFLNPDLMVIGDSVPQGCRSLTVSAEFCRQSYPAQVAYFAKCDFAVPQHPRPVLFDLEAIAGDLLFHGLGAVLGGIGNNYAAWLQDFKNTAVPSVHFDNLAVAGFTLEDILGEATQAVGGGQGYGTAALCDSILATAGQLNPLKDFGKIADLHQAVNARYVLNPTNEAQYANFSQIDWVKLRQPKTLIVHIGHNNGFYAMGSKAETAQWEANWSAGPEAKAPAWELYKRVVDTLVLHLPKTRIIFVGLPKLSAVANLMPLDNIKSDNPAYFVRYQTQFPNTLEVSGRALQRMDEEVRRVNGDMATYIKAMDAGRGQLRYFDMYGFFDAHDTKNLGRPGIGIGSQRLDNTYIKGKHTRQPGGKPGTPAVYKYEFQSGGFQSIDGMHPTVVGYALLAFELQTLLTGKELTQQDQLSYLLRMVRKERLVWMFPQGLVGLLELLRGAGAAGGDEQKLALCGTIQSANEVFV